MIYSLKPSIIWRRNAAYDDDEALKYESNAPFRAFRHGCTTWHQQKFQEAQ
jgi:hypothetical protein